MLGVSPKVVKAGTETLRQHDLSEATWECVKLYRLLYRFLDAGNTEAGRTLGEPASKKRRCTKSRDAGQRLGGERSEARYEVLGFRNSKSGGLETGGRIKRCGTIFADTDLIL